MWGKAMMLRNAAGSLGFRLNQNSRWSHTAALQAPLERVMDLKNETESVGKSGNKQSMEAPHFGFGGSMELMAVPKKKVSPYKRGLRNGPKALKPVPVIMRCRCFEVVLGLTMNTWRAWFESAEGRIMWKMVPFAVFWSIWKERNRRIFETKVTTMEGIIFTN
ncbi:uncharacterized protein LOC131230973 isoform X1 [Magnolia sinica]|uniref:uncharacterized protein LOC131230973 isoform X1 n=1 Tax=Magnolia sinica TaxID=86752 RepID=UPI00265AD64D|nr:uncharacterized protein LOC131230973 isoform X1 [Magnolia sinica]